MATPNLKVLETVRRHYNDRYLLMGTANGAPEDGRLGIPPGPGLGVDLRAEFLHSGRVHIEGVDERSVDKSGAAWHAGQSAHSKENE